jgi:hypothetical protein
MSTDRIAALEAKIASAQAELVELKVGRSAPPPPPPPRDEVRIVQINDERTDGLPNLKEMQKLFSIVRPHSPWPSALADRFDEERPFRAFGSAFRWAANMRRIPQPDSKRALSYWCDGCRLWLRERNCVASDLDANALVLAVLAQGDVAYTASNPQMGWVWELGLHEHTGRRAAPDSWRRVLEGGAILPPSVPRRMAPPSPVRVIVGGGW